MLTDLEARHGCVDWLKLASDFGGCQRLHVKHVDVTWATQQIHQDYRFGRATRCVRRDCLRLNEVRQREPERRDGTDD